MASTGFFNSLERAAPLGLVAGEGRHGLGDVPALVANLSGEGGERVREFRRWTGEVVADEFGGELRTPRGAAPSAMFFNLPIGLLHSLNRHPRVGCRREWGALCPACHGASPLRAGADAAARRDIAAAMSG